MPAKSQHSLAVDTALLIPALTVVNGLVGHLAKETAQKMRAQRMLEVRLTKPVAYTDPDAERPEIGSVKFNEDNSLVAVDANDPDQEFLLEDMDPNTFLAILQALP